MRTGAGCGRTAQASRRRARRRVAAVSTGFDRGRPRTPPRDIDKGGVHSRRSVEAIAARRPPCRRLAGPPRDVVNAAVDAIGLRSTDRGARITARATSRYTVDRILAEETTVLDLAGARDDRAQSWVEEATPHG